MEAIDASNQGIFPWGVIIGFSVKGINFCFRDRKGKAMDSQKGIESVPTVAWHPLTTSLTQYAEYLAFCESIRIHLCFLQSRTIRDCLCPAQFLREEERPTDAKQS